MDFTSRNIPDEDMRFALQTGSIFPDPSNRPNYVANAKRLISDWIKQMDEPYKLPRWLQRCAYPQPTFADYVAWIYVCRNNHPMGDPPNNEKHRENWLRFSTEAVNQLEQEILAPMHAYHERTMIMKHTVPLLQEHLPNTVSLLVASYVSPTIDYKDGSTTSSCLDGV